ncbi:hypothetical protein D9C73_002790 [Collichthys lucidus]|uniref:Uncharacterized protein n=1 Tax=Collichthys lucidus TaxID=240159 RepID=A0A4U5U3J0_COLLU|nr:hypothetical protein D9C73_002790 [Collichthys lucidus]
MLSLLLLISGVSAETGILQFPPVSLDEKDSGAIVNFMNPYHHYKELKQASKSALASVTVTVTSDDGDHTFDCSAKEEYCKHEVTFREGVKKCVTLIKGFLGAPDYIGSVGFNTTDPICVTESTAVICICKVKAWTMDDTPLPKPLILDHGEQDLDYDKVSIANITVGPVFMPYKDSLVSSEEENSPTKNLQDRSSSSSGSDFENSAHEKRGLSDSRNQDLEAAGLLSEGQRTDDDSVKTECTSMDLGEEEEEEEVEEEVERSPYDCPHTVQVDMGDGDIATGYTGR